VVRLEFRCADLSMRRLECSALTPAIDLHHTGGHSPFLPCSVR
jgi:hypothetical protein